MAGENKNLEIGVVVNEGQMSKFNRAIQDATREVNKLAEALNRASNTFKGFLSGANVSGGGANSMVFRPGSGFTKSPMASAGVGQPAIAVANTIKSVTKESTESLRTLDQTVRTASSKMASSLDPLDRALANIEKRFKNIKSVGGGVMLPGVGGGQGMSAAPYGVENRGGIDYAKAPPTTLERLTNRLFQPVFGGSSGQQAAAANNGFGLKAAAAQLGIPGWAMGGAGVVGGAIGAYSAFTNGFVGRESAVAGEVLQAQTDSLRRRYAQQQSMGALSMQVRRDPLMQYTLSHMGTTDLHAGLSEQTFNAMVQQAFVKAGVTGKVTDVARNWWDKFSAVGVQAIGSDLPNDNSIQNQNLDRAVNDVKSQILQLESKNIQTAYGANSAEIATWLPEFHQQAAQRMSTMRAAHRGGTRKMRMVPVKNPVTNQWDFQPLPDEGVSVAQTLGFGSPYYKEEVAGMMQRIGASAGMGSISEGLAKSMLGASYGGLTNATDIYNVGNQYGNAGLFRTFASGIGVDTTAANQMSAIVMAAMQQGNYSIGGSFAAEGIGAAFNTGTPGGDMRMARIAGAGAQAYDAMLSGGTDNLQKAINVLSANQAAGGASIQAKHALQGIGSVQLMEIMRSGKVPQQLADYGITPAMVSSYVATQNRFAFSRYITGTGAGNDVEKAVLGARAAGGAGAYINQLLNGQHFKSQRDRVSFIQRQAQLLGEGLHSTGEAMTNEAGQGRVLMELGQSAKLFPNASGGGAYDPAANSLEVQAKINDEAAELAKEQFYRDHGGPVANTGGKGAQKQAGVLSGLAGDVGSTVARLKSALDDLVRDINAVAKGSPLGKAGPQ